MRLDKFSNSNSKDDGQNKTWINFNFENCVSIAHEGVLGSPNQYRVRLRMDSGYKLEDVNCEWTDARKRALKLSASTKVTGKATVRVTKSFEIIVDPGCQVVGDASPTLTRFKDKDECWVQFPVTKLPDTLPVAEGTGAK